MYYPMYVAAIWLLCWLPGNVMELSILYIKQTRYARFRCSNCLDRYESDYWSSHAVVAKKEVQTLERGSTIPLIELVL